MDSILQDAGFFVLCTPALPWDSIEDWARGVRAAAAWANGTAGDAALQSDLDLLRSRLRSLVKQPAIQSALFIASPDLFAQLGPWLNGEDGGTVRVESAVVRYLMRMAGRATPFGLFAGTSVGTLDARVVLHLPPASSNVAHTRLDTEFVYNLADCMTRTPELADAVRYTPADAAYTVGGRLRYCEPHVSRSARTFRLVDVHPSPYLSVALDAARREGGATRQEIAQAICGAFPDVETAEAMSFVEALVSAQLLRSAWVPAVTGADPALDLLATLNATPSARSHASPLCDALRVLNDPEQSQSDQQAIQFARTATIVSCSYPGVESARVLRCDLRKPGGELTLSRRLVHDMRRYLDRLARISGPPPRTAMRSFIDQFQSRYQGGMVPLLQALDEESGVGFDDDGDWQSGVSPLLADIPFEPPETAKGEWNARVAWLFERLAAVLGTGASELVLSDGDIEALSTKQPPPMPSGAAVLATIAASCSDAVERGDYRIYLRKAFGPNSARLLGRFCQTDPELYRHVRAALKREEACDPDAIHAEVVHLPHYRAANAICRPVLRDYEIPLFDRSGAPQARVISLQDLLVSVERNRVVLRSQRLGRRVVPHLTCAHAFQTSGVGLYRFLASLEEQDTWSELSFSWGPLSSAPYLPRVVHERCVYALAQWTVSGSEWRRIARLSAAPRFRALQELRARLQLPRFVVLADADNALPIDFDNALSLQSFLKTAERSSRVVINETFPPPNELVVRGDEGRFQHELVIPFVRESAGVTTDPLSRASSPRMYDTKARNHPGSRWLFVKAYGGAAAVDRALVEIVAPFVATQRRRQAIDRWFFVRYADPHWHLRIRLYGEPSRLWNQVAPALLERLASADGLIHRTVVDTYDREEDRYGGPAAMDVADRLFEADSDAAVAIIQEYGGDLDARWVLALYGMDALMSDFGLSVQDKRATVLRCHAAQISALSNDRRQRRKVGERYRTMRSQIEALFGGSPGPLQPGVTIIRARSAELVRLAAELRGLEQSGPLTFPIDVTLESYLHMWANRVLRAAINLQESVLYDFLGRIYQRPQFGFALQSPRSADA